MIFDIYLKFEPRDLWIGAYWDLTKGTVKATYRCLKVYVCIVPMFPLCLSWEWWLKEQRMEPSGKTAAMWEHASKHAKAGDVLRLHLGFEKRDQYFRFDGVKWDEIDDPSSYVPPHGWCSNCKELPAGSVGGLCDECRPAAFDALLGKHIDE